MNNLLPSWMGAMLICVPVSLALATLARISTLDDPEPPTFLALWGASYFVTVFAAATVFVGGIGVMLMVGAFR